ncbi:hypothetical protein ACFWVP_06635 [Streptomyces sp. NPDC058637]|uniref:hypothetical protein n=1 Tax=Streptomyces sp. NPDC058637 TaxID=3346569 RepID=UPI00366469AF
MSQDPPAPTGHGPDGATGAPGAASGGAADASEAPKAGDGAPSPAPDAPEEEAEQPQDAWSARRDLYAHSPGIMVGASARFEGGLSGRDQHGVSGGHVVGDVIMGSKTEIYQLGVSSDAHTSGLVPQDSLDRTAALFVPGGDGSVFTGLVERLRTERVLVLSGQHFTGRRTAALMLLNRLGATPVRALDRDTTPAALPGLLDGARGHVLCDLALRRDLPLRDTHLLALRDRLVEQDAYLVITVDPAAALEDVSVAHWRPPRSRAVLEAHLTARPDGPAGLGAEAAALLEHRSVKEFLDRGHQLREVAAFARLLARVATGRAAGHELEHFSLAALESQVEEWFGDPSASLSDKAFLVSLAAFDEAPYALTAELSDALYALLQKTEDPSKSPLVPVFGNAAGGRLNRARAERYEENEMTEWGPVAQRKARYRDDRTALVLLREVWTGHPSARPALVAWLDRLADDGRPLVRTRAASTAAVLAAADLPSAMALVITRWATSRRYRQRLVAVNALTLAHFLGAPNVLRILGSWCTGGDRRERWTAIRAYALIGPAHPAQALLALRSAACTHFAAGDGRGGDTDRLAEEIDELSSSVALLLLSPAGGQVLAEMESWLGDEPALRDLALRAFLYACAHPQDDDPAGSPAPLLEWYAQASAVRAPQARDLTDLWAAALRDRHHTDDALAVLRTWTWSADHLPRAEAALTALLSDLAETETDRRRLAHLLRTMPAEDGGATPPPVAGRMLAVVDPG